MLREVLITTYQRDSSRILSGGSPKARFQHQVTVIHDLDGGGVPFSDTSISAIADSPTSWQLSWRTAASRHWTRLGSVLIAGTRAALGRCSLLMDQNTSKAIIFLSKECDSRGKYPQLPRSGLG